MKWMLLALAICPNNSIPTTGFYCKVEVTRSNDVFYESREACEAAAPGVLAAIAAETPAIAHPFTSAWFCQAVNKIDF